MHTILRERSFLIKIIIILCLVSILPIFILSLIVNYYTQKSLQEEINSSNALYLKQSVASIEIIIKQIKENCRQLSLDSVFVDFARFPNANYYENLKGELKSEDISANYNFIMKKNQVISRLSNLKASSEYVDSVYYCDDNRKIVYTDNGFAYAMSEFFDSQLLSSDYYIESSKKILSPVSLDSRIATLSDGTTKNVLSLIYRSFSGGIAFIVNLDANKIYHDIFNKLNNDAKNNIYLLTETGDFVFQSNIPSAEIVDQIQAIYSDLSVTEGESGAFTTSVIDNEYLVQYERSDLLNWIFIRILNLDELYMTIEYIRLILLLSSVILIMLLIVLAFICGAKIYRPINGIVQYIKSKGQADDPCCHTLKHDEFPMIRNMLDREFQEKNEFKKRLSESLPAYKEKFLMSLLRNRNGDCEDIRKRLAYFNINLDEKKLLVCILMIDRPPAFNYDAISYEKFILLDLIENYIQAYSGVAIEAEESKFVTILNCTQNDAFKFAQEITIILKNKINTRFTIGISRQCYDITHLYVAYEEANEALSYRMLTGNDETIFIDDITIQKRTALNYSIDKEDTIYSFIKYGDQDGAVKVYDDFMGDLLTPENNMHLNEFQHICLKILTSVYDFLNNAGLDSTNIYSQGFTLYMNLNNKNKIHESIQILRDIILQAANLICNSQNEKSSNYTEEVAKIVNEYFNDNISLNSVAEKLNLNPAYLSRVFKKHAGLSFTEYLTRIRIEKSKVLLLETNKKIIDISREIGYSNSYYYIKLFKNHTGTTPNEYRKKCRK